MNLIQLKYFIEIFDTQSITVAARNLFVTQPTLSLSLKKLEESLNVQLLIRTENAYQLTESGQLLYEEGKQLLEQFEQLQQDVQNLSTYPQKEKLQVGMTTLYSFQFMQEIATFMAQHPEIELMITQDGSRQLQRMLKDKILDVALVSLPNFESETVKIEQLTNTTIKGYTVYVVLPENNPLAEEKSLSFLQLKDQHFSTLSDHFVIGDLLYKRANELGFNPHIVALHNDLQVLLYSLSQSNSITLLPIEYNEIYKIPGLKWVPLDDRYNYFPIGIGLHREKKQSKSIVDFINAIKQN
ncbi:LysR family transcriptional regulator [Carnobacteriaceae bacterium 52-44]